MVSDEGLRRERGARRPSEEPAPGLLGRSPAFLKARDELLMAAPYDVAVLLEGETGTGKELFARLLHRQSPRRGGALVSINCAAIPAQLMESEFFGHRRGSFTHAHEDRRGLIAEADRGTLFLDEITALELPLQAKLLRFLQEREYRRVGDDRTQSADVRLVAAANSALDAAAREGRFRWDLYHRLSVFPVRLPPLRERVEDIPLLLDHLLERYSHRFALGRPRLSPRALEALIAHPWPGNVRELENLAQRITIRCRDRVVQVEDLDLQRDGAGREAARASGPQSFAEQKTKLVGQFERRYLEELMASFHGNVTHAARFAGKSRRTLTALLKKTGIQPATYRPR